MTALLESKWILDGSSFAPCSIELLLPWLEIMMQQNQNQNQNEWIADGCKRDKTTTMLTLMPNHGNFCKIGYFSPLRLHCYCHKLPWLSLNIHFILIDHFSCLFILIFISSFLPHFQLLPFRLHAKSVMKMKNVQESEMMIKISLLWVFCWIYWWCRW